MHSGSQDYADEFNLEIGENLQIPTYQEVQVDETPPENNPLNNPKSLTSEDNYQLRVQKQYQSGSSQNHSLNWNICTIK